MKLVDLNLLLYAVNRDSGNHARAKAWLEEMLTGEETIALPWVVILGFLRVSTNARILPHPLSPAQAMGVVDSWLTRPQVLLLDPSDAHWRILRDALTETGTAGNLTTDAHLAALAIEHDAELCSTDGDFARFAQLRWVNPLAG
ncbi:MAG TPA: type II toxin-antitoxin system VapC family toxin [Gemmatimonadaceae bacterium]|nr:type II toxin-antitoxin system VapC family toxin [Gemmatimonadaceae bacterium]